MQTPLLELTLPIAFGDISPSDVVPAVRSLLAGADERVRAIDARTPGYEATLGELEACTEQLEIAMNIVEHLEGVATTPELRRAYNAVLPDVSAFWSSLPLRENVWHALLALAGSADAATLDAERRRFLEKTLLAFRRHGAELAAPDKERLSDLDRELSSLTAKFSENVLDSTNAFELWLTGAETLAGVPAWVVEAAAEGARAKGREGYRLTLTAPVVTAILGYAEDRALRETIWRAYNTRATEPAFDNRPLIARILELRRDKARLLGRAHFADLVAEDRMAKAGGTARRFVDELSDRTRTAFERENRELEDYRRTLEGATAPALGPWDIPYYAEKLRRERYDLDEEELRRYFESARVLEGAFRIAERLYGVRVERAHGVPGWHPSVTAYRMSDPSGAELGTFYVDAHPRESKRGGAWMHGLVAALPPRPHVAVLAANLSPPVGGRPSLLTHREVETVFHEFGHLLHHCLSRVGVRSLACTRVAQDFVELPSQIMENWCSERDALNLFAADFVSGAPLPDDVLERLRAARTFRAANAQMRQLGFAAVDLALHTEYDAAKDGDPLAYARGILDRYSAAPLPADYAMLAGFLHLFASPIGYAAGYYSYKWAEVLEADAFSRFRDEGVLDAGVGRSFRDAILERGDSRDPMDLFVGFMGREPRPDALLERQGLSP